MKRYDLEPVRHNPYQSWQDIIAQDGTTVFKFTAPVTKNDVCEEGMATPGIKPVFDFLAKVVG